MDQTQLQMVSYTSDPTMYSHSTTLYVTSLSSKDLLSSFFFFFEFSMVALYLKLEGQFLTPEPKSKHGSANKAHASFQYFPPALVSSFLLGAGSGASPTPIATDRSSEQISCRHRSVQMLCRRPVGPGTSQLVRFGPQSSPATRTTRPFSRGRAPNVYCTRH